jgi:hypothetical protein
MWLWCNLLSDQCNMQCICEPCSSFSVQGVMLGKRKSLMKTIELREKRKRRREEMEVVFNRTLCHCCACVCNGGIIIVQTPAWPPIAFLGNSFCSEPCFCMLSPMSHTACWWLCTHDNHCQVVPRCLARNVDNLTRCLRLVCGL